MARPSKWYDHAMLVIHRALEGWDPTVGEAATRKHLSAAYPFGAKANHPYKMWCKAVRDTLNALYPVEQAEVRYTPRGVVCGWCSSFGCLVCTEARLTYKQLVKERPREVKTWKALDADARADPELLPILADFVGDVLGLEGEAQQLRRN